MSNALLQVPVNKVQHYELYLKGVYGNKPLAWRNGAEMWESGYRGCCTVRGRTANSGCSIRQYGVPAEEARHSEGFINETMPDDFLLIQGEFQQDIRHLYVHYSRIKGISNQAALQGPGSEHAWGIKARRILQYFMDANSYGNVDRLLTSFQGAVVEFSTFSKPVGDFRWNTVFWEVRNY